ncbi:hypothetical protein PanWU01x14_241030, partial [Parasponia andersonii]
MKFARTIRSGTLTPCRKHSSASSGKEKMVDSEGGALVPYNWCPVATLREF